MWTNAVTELRRILADGDTDKRVILKKCIGKSDGVNKQFITFEMRRLTDFTTALFPFGVYVDGVSVPVTLDDTTSGVFELTTAPAVNKSVEASYYSQWFTSDQLTQFLNDASLFCRSSDDFNNIDVNLRHAALKYASSEAYQYLSLYWSRQTAESFKLNDAIEKDRYNLIKSYADMSKTYREEAEKIRDDYYQRGGRQKQPLWGLVRGK